MTKTVADKGYKPRKKSLPFTQAQNLQIEVNCTHFSVAKQQVV